MTNKKSTKKALLTSTLCLLLCMSMLVGTTFAWFTDSVSSNNNLITAGNLDVNLYWSTDAQNWAEVNSDTNVFMEDTLWEPGHTEVVYLKVVNEGSLALKYDLNVNVDSEVEGTNVYQETFKLSDYILYSVKDGVETYANSAEARGDETGAKLNAPYNKATTLEAGKETVLTMVVFMPTTVGNEANYLHETVAPSINLGINLFATQFTHEEDSYGPEYDGDALVCDILAKPETINDILATVEPGTVIGLSAGYYDEIVLTQDNLTLVSNSGVVGFLNLNAKDGATIDGVTFDESGAKETYTFKTGNVQAATEYVANITGDTNSPKAAGNVTIKNCTFTNTNGIATVAASYYAPIYFNEQGAATERASNITIESCVFACNAHQYIALNYLSEGEVVVANNVFGSINYGTGHNTIQATANAANWTITGNSFNNWNVEKTAIGSSKQGSNTVTWTVTGNEFNHKADAVIIALKTSYTAANSVVNVANNTVLAGNGMIVTTDVNAENENVFGGHKIQMNSGVTTVFSQSELKASNVKNATIVLAPGTYETVSLAEGVTLIGAEGTVIKQAAGSQAALGSTKNTTIKNVEFVGTNAQRWGYAGGDVVFENCTFKGEGTDSLSWAIHYDGTGGANLLYKNCEIYGWVAIGGGASSLVFDGCNFYGNGAFGLCRSYSDFTVKNCTFDYSNVDPNGTRAVGIEALSGATVTVENCTNVNGDIMDVVSDMYFGTSYEGNVIVDGNKVNVIISNADELFAFAEAVNGGNSYYDKYVYLSADIDLENKLWTPIGQTGATEFKGIFDGRNHTIKNLNVDSSAQTGENYSSGLFGWAESHVTIKNVKVDGAKVVGNHNVAVIVGYTYSAKIVNCHVTNAEIVCNHANDDACGDKCGLIAGYAGDESRFADCSASNSAVKAGRDAGQLFGLAYNVSVSNCTATNVTVGTTEGCTHANAGKNIHEEIIGRVM